MAIKVANAGVINYIIFGESPYIFDRDRIYLYLFVNYYLLVI